MYSEDYREVAMCDVPFCSAVQFIVLSGKADIAYCPVSHHRIPELQADGSGFANWVPGSKPVNEEKWLEWTRFCGVNTGDRINLDAGGGVYTMPAGS